MSDKMSAILKISISDVVQNSACTLSTALGRKLDEDAVPDDCVTIFAAFVMTIDVFRSAMTMNSPA